MEPDERRRSVTFNSAEAFRAFLETAMHNRTEPTTRQASTWLQSSYSPGGKQRVLVARLADGSALVGSAGNGLTLHIPQDEWIAFVKGIQAGEFEPLAGEELDEASQKYDDPRC